MLSRRRQADRPLSVANSQAFAGTDPTSLHFARPSSSAQRAFWVNYIAGHILDSEPRLNFLAKGGGGAIVANLLPAQEVCRNVLCPWLHLCARNCRRHAATLQCCHAHGRADVLRQLG